MHKNFSEIATHEKRLCSKAVVLKNTFFPWALLCLVAGNSFFRVQCFFMLQTYLRPFIRQWILYFLQEHLQPWIAYIQCIWQIFLFKACCYFIRALSTIQLSGTIIIPGGQLQWSIIFSCTLFLWNKHLQLSLCSKIPYRGNFRRGKVTKCWLGDENFPRRNFPNKVLS